MKNISVIIIATLLLAVVSCSNEIKKYENTIAEIKKQELQIGKLEKYKMEDFSNTSTIKKMPDDFNPERGNGKGCMWVFKTQSNLLVFIETEDNGHAGEYGLVYSENGQLPVWNYDEWGERWSIDKKINSNWWYISFRLG